MTSQPRQPRTGHPTPGVGGAAPVPASARGSAPGPVPVRGPLRRFLEARGSIGGHASPHRRRRIRTRDGVWLAATWLPGPAAAAAPADVPAVVLLHGFAASAGKPAYARLADELQRHATVLAVDLRGHGRSGGSSSLGDRERHDVAAAVATLRGDGHRHVTVVGVSMGSTAAVHAVATGTRVDALVLVSGPGFLHPEPRTEPLRRLHRHWNSRMSRAAMRVALRVRVAPPAGWSAPRHPGDLVPDGVPTLVVHGTDDTYFPPDHGRALARGDQAVLWLLDDFGHAEDGLDPAVCRRLGAALAEEVATGAFPPATSGPGDPSDAGPTTHPGRR